MGSRQTAASSSASQGPRRRRCARAGGQAAKKTPQQTHWNRLVYLLNDPRPIQSPIQSHCRVEPPGCRARQPATSAAVQNRTDNGSIVINREPSAMSGVTLRMATAKNAARPLTSRARNRSSSSDNPAEISGEKKRTPNWLSPHRCVPRNCTQAMRSGLL